MSTIAHKTGSTTVCVALALIKARINGILHQLVMGSPNTIILLLLAKTLSVFANNSTPATLCSSSACILKDSYNRMDLPPTKAGKPVEVNFTLQLMDIYSIDHEAYTLHMNIVFRYKWIDNRITLGKGIEAVDKNFLNHLWMPHVYAYDQGLTGRVFQLRVGYGSGIGKNILGRFGYGSGSGIGIIFRANRVLSGI